MRYDTVGSPLRHWSEPQCSFVIEYSARALDDIRLAVVDSFFSVPRGGVEIGGILLGVWEEGMLRILEYAALDCEHANGPAFTLSARDEEKLRSLLDEAPAQFPGLIPVGWYHSHTRSEIFLSEADLEIHHSYFPKPWHVALVLKPHTFEPTRAGFFFQEGDGSIHASAPYREIVLEPLPMKAVPANPNTALPTAAGRPSTVRMERNQALGVPSEAASPVTPQQALQPSTPPATDQPKPETMQGLEPPFFHTAPVPVWPRRLGIALLCACVVMAVIGIGYRTQAQWLPRVLAAVRPAPPAAPPGVSLTVLDRDGQLQINWDRTAPQVSGAVDAIIEISDGSPLPHAITLDQANLQNGHFTYGRQSERVDVSLILHQAEGQTVRAVTTFVGKLPAHSTPAEDPEIRRQRDELAAKANKLKTDLDSQAARTRKLENDLKTMQDEMKSQQQRRMTNQLPEGKQ